MKGNHPGGLEHEKELPGGLRNQRWSSEVKARNDALNLFTKRTFLVAVKGSLRRASTPLTEDFQVTNRSSHSIDIKRGKKGYVETMVYLTNSQL